MAGKTEERMVGNRAGRMEEKTVGNTAGRKAGRKVGSKVELLVLLSWMLQKLLNRKHLMLLR